MPASDARRRVPSIDALLRTPAGRKAARKFGRPVVRQAFRQVLESIRADAARGREIPDDDVLLARAVHLTAHVFYDLRPVINATGVLLHTGLGRAPLAKRAVVAVARAAGAYTDLEVDRETGGRGRRTARAEFILTAITGAEAALVVNNNAAALLLTLAALAKRKEVVVSRGELIEIGGEFRLPDIMAASGAKLVEVGTTNRTRATDYERAFTERTALVLKVHPSNYRLSGFTASVPLGPLAGLAHRHGVPVVYDTGSGLIARRAGIPEEEPAATESLQQGADLVCFSGDKLLGGPQAGIVLGRADLVAHLRAHPVARAVRVDVMTVAALEATLRVYAAGDVRELPLWRSLEASARSLRQRAKAIAGTLSGAAVIGSEAVVGGGSLPGYTLPSAGIRLPVADPGAFAAYLRDMRPPVFCRVQDEAVVFDLRAVAPEDDDRLARAVSYALRS